MSFILGLYYMGCVQNTAAYAASPDCDLSGCVLYVYVRHVV